MVPDGAAATATFDMSTTIEMALSANTTVDGITFNARTVNPYRITTAANTTLMISGTGLTNKSGATQSFVIDTLVSLLAERDLFSGRSDAHCCSYDGE